MTPILFIQPVCDFLFIASDFVPEKGKLFRGAHQESKKHTGST